MDEPRRLEGDTAPPRRMKYLKSERNKRAIKGKGEEEDRNPNPNPNPNASSATSMKSPSAPNTPTKCHVLSIFCSGRFSPPCCPREFLEV